MLAHLPIVILTSLHPIPVADTAPKLDIARECQFEGGIKPTQERCVVDETQARNQLQNEWKQFGLDAKKQCNEESTGQHRQLRRIADLPGNEAGCEESPEVIGVNFAQAANINCHHPPPGRRNAPPDDRLQRVIQ